MKKKIRMTCILKSGAVIKDAIRISKKDSQWVPAIAAINQMKNSLENGRALDETQKMVITFGHTTIHASEVAAIKIW